VTRWTFGQPGRPILNDFPFGRRAPVFIAFDLVFADGEHVLGRGVETAPSVARKIVRGKQKPNAAALMLRISGLSTKEVSSTTAPRHGGSAIEPRNTINIGVGS
jgi:hypothetical protein